MEISTSLPSVVQRCVCLLFRRNLCKPLLTFSNQVYNNVFSFPLQPLCFSFEVLVNCTIHFHCFCLQVKVFLKKFWGHWKMPTVTLLVPSSVLAEVFREPAYLLPPRSWKLFWISIFFFLTFLNVCIKFAWHSDGNTAQKETDREKRDSEMLVTHAHHVNWPFQQTVKVLWNESGFSSLFKYTAYELIILNDSKLHLLFTK